MKSTLIYLLILSTLAGVGCSGSPSSFATKPHQLGGSSDCKDIVGPVNDGPGSCTDCLAELCVEIEASDMLNFYVRVLDELDYPTELCTLTDVVVTQSTNTLFNGNISLSPLELEPGVVLISVEDPLVTANPMSGVEVTIAKGPFGRPTCD